MMSPHGIPVDLLDRLVIIRTLQYVLEEIIAILNTRAKVCFVTCDESVLCARPCEACTACDIRCCMSYQNSSCSTTSLLP